VYYLANDIMHTHNRLNPAFQPNGLGMTAGGLGWRVWNAMAFWMTFAAWLSMLHSLTSALGVACGWGDASDWPYMFGKLADLTTVRGFWGRTWHQFLRRPLATHGKYLANTVLRFTPGSLLSSYTQLIVGFFLSGLYHACGDWKVSHDPASAQATVYFFVIQAFAIMFEDAVIGLGRMVGVRNNAGLRAVGMVWVALWMGLSGPIWMEPMINGGLLVGGLPFATPDASIVVWVIKRLDLCRLSVI